MKFPSILKLPNHRKFDFSPRHFDPIKDEIEERTQKIKRELSIEQNDGMHAEEAPRGTIKFERKERANRSASLIQLIIAAVLATLCFGWLYYGNDVFYTLFAVFPVYLYFRIKNKFK